MDWPTLKTLIGFWIFGLCNNYAYVIMLSAAEDILNKQEHVNTTRAVDTCEDSLTSRHCTPLSTGTVLLADVLPTLFVKLTFPLFMQRIPFGIRHMAICLIQAASFIIVAFSVDVTMSLFGVAVASFGSGLGEITYLSFTPFFGRNTISAWSSGTGGAGIIGALAYAGLTEPKLANLSPTNTVLVMLVIPVIFALTYYCLLNIPKAIYQVNVFDPRTWIVPETYLSKRRSTLHSKRTVSDLSSSVESCKIENGSDVKVDDERVNEQNNDEDRQNNDSKTRGYTMDIREGKIKQRSLSVKQKFLLIIPLLKFMLPLTVVYLGEYLINQGIVQLIIFNCSHGFALSRSSQYRWYQVIYQLGVFISRSSINVFRLPHWALVLIAVLQLLNAVLFLLDSLYFFIPHIGIIFALILFEGLFGGTSYVNTFDHIHRSMPPDVREYSLSISSLGDSIGIVIAGFIAIPLHNWICSTSLPSH
ncbi:unnamed protein product [Anisakis simplex]|uniref:Battenin n=1 Tax=Anisakis simplex TaxID=6269 RepID=A0A0M3JW70_ANISI|nr:unnamed protein product [Anisakis simplex]